MLVAMPKDFLRTRGTEGPPSAARAGREVRVTMRVAKRMRPASMFFNSVDGMYLA